MATKSRREDTPAGRIYDIEGVGRFPSVTTVLDVIGKPALVEWAARIERDHAVESAADLWEALRPLAAAHDPKTRMARLAYTETLKRRMGSRHQWKRERDAALQIGREVHDVIEWHMRKLAGIVTKQPVVGEPAMIAYGAFSTWLEFSGFEPRWIEFPVWSERHGYAGTLDTCGLLPLITAPPDPFARIHGTPAPAAAQQVVALGDWKSSRRIFSEAVIQVSAYVVALREMGHLPPELGDAWGFIVRLPKRQGDASQVFMISPEQQAAAFEVFLAALTVWRWLAEPLDCQEVQVSNSTQSPGIHFPQEVVAP